MKSGIPIVTEPGFTTACAGASQFASEKDDAGPCPYCCGKLRFLCGKIALYVTLPYTPPRNAVLLYGLVVRDYP